VSIDGVSVGKTPISLSLPVGVRLAEFRTGQASSRTPLNIEAGKITAQHVDFAAAPLTGALEIVSDPPGARVSVDGRPRGQTPLKISELTPGQHRVRLASGRTSVDRRVVVTAGASAMVVVVWKPESAPREPNPPRLAANVLQSVDVRNGAIYTALDRDVTPPVELERTIPAWSPPEQLASRWFRGVVQVVVDERGSVESAQLVKSLADFYDPGLLGAARAWRFTPALRAEQPVRYRKIVEITMSPRQ
jgi:TonB family protein